MHRRSFLGSAILAVSSGSAIASRIQPAKSTAPAPRDHSAAESLGWELGTQAWTFRDRTCFEAIDTAKSLGLTCIELFPGQLLAPDTKDIKVGPALTADQRKRLKDKLASAGVRANSFGVVGPGVDEKPVREFFEFAKDMGMKGISCEPALDPAKLATKSAQSKPATNPDEALKAWRIVDKLTREYNLYAACHNHPKPNTYWDPEVLLRALGWFDNPLLGACADTGHWVRSGLSPVDCLKKYQGKVFELHFKDVQNDVDHPWGTGGGDARGQLAELKRQGFKGSIFLEYESGEGKELEANVRKCIEFFDRTARELA